MSNRHAESSDFGRTREPVPDYSKPYIPTPDYMNVDRPRTDDYKPARNVRDDYAGYPERKSSKDESERYRFHKDYKDYGGRPKSNIRDDNIARYARDDQAARYRQAAPNESHLKSSRQILYDEHGKAIAYVEGEMPASTTDGNRSPTKREIIRPISYLEDGRPVWPLTPSQQTLSLEDERNLLPVRYSGPSLYPSEDNRPLQQQQQQQLYTRNGTPIRYMSDRSRYRDGKLSAYTDNTRETSTRDGKNMMIYHDEERRTSAGNGMYNQNSREQGLATHVRDDWFIRPKEYNRNVSYVGNTRTTVYGDEDLSHGDIGGAPQSKYYRDDPNWSEASMIHPRQRMMPHGHPSVPIAGNQQYAYDPRQYMIDPQQHRVDPRNHIVDPRQRMTDPQQHTISPRQHPDHLQQYATEPWQHPFDLQQQQRVPPFDPRLQGVPLPY